MGRRGFIGSLIALVAGLFGVGKANAALPAKVGSSELDEATVPWLIKRIWDDVQRPLNAQLVITSYHCGDGNCPAPKCFYEGFIAMPEGNGADDEGFAAIITTPRHRYRISVKANYLGCTVINNTPDPGESWMRGSDLADGKRTVGTWWRIVADIERTETTGSKYARSQGGPAVRFAGE